MVVLTKEGDQKVFCSPSSGLSNPRRLTSATPIRGISRPGAVPSGLLSPRWCFEKIESEKSLCFRHLDFSLWLMTYKLLFLLLFCRFVHYAADRCSTFVGQFRTICCSITSHRHNAQKLNIFHTGLCISLWECCKCFCVCRPMNIT